MNPQMNLKSSALSLVKRNSLNIQKICIFLILYAISHLSICWMHKRSIQQYHKVGWALVFENGHQHNGTQKHQESSPPIKMEHRFHFWHLVEFWRLIWVSCYFKNIDQHHTPKDFVHDLPKWNMHCWTVHLNDRTRKEVVQLKRRSL